MPLVLIALLLGAAYIVDSLFTDTDINVENLAHKNWNDFNVLGALIEAEKACADDRKISNCESIESWIKDVRISFVSCKADPSSSLCKGLLQVAEDDRYKGLFKDVENLNPVELPHNPLYLMFGKLPTKFLEENASDFGYTEEMYLQFYAKWKIRIWIGGTGALMFLLFVIFKSERPAKDMDLQQEVKYFSPDPPVENPRLYSAPNEKWYQELDEDESEERFAQERQQEEEEKVQWDRMKQKVLNLTEAEKAAFDRLKNNIQQTLSP